MTDSGCHCVSADHSSRVVGSDSVASSSELLLLGPVFETKAATSKSGNGVGRGLFDMCRVNADVFPSSQNSYTHIAMIVADAAKLTESGLSDSQSVNRTTLFSLSQTNYHSNHR